METRFYSFKADIIIIIIIIIIYSFRVFHISVNWWFYTGVWVTASLLKSPGLVSGFWPFLAMLSFGWIVSTRPPISKSSRPFNSPLVIVPNTPITIGTIVTSMFHSFFNSLARSRYLSFFSLPFRFILWSPRTAYYYYYYYCCYYYYNYYLANSIILKICNLK